MDEGSGTGVPLKIAFTDTDPVYQGPVVANPESELRSTVIGLLLILTPSIPAMLPLLTTKLWPSAKPGCGLLAAKMLGLIAV